MADNGLNFGDLPAWCALVISIWTAFHQRRVNLKAEELRQASALKSEKQRESDQRKNRLECLQRDIDDLSAMAIDYWMRAGSETGTSGVVINTKIKDISSRFSRYHKLLWHNASIDFLAFKQAVTGGEFQSPRREALNPRSGTVSAISSSSNLLKDKLRCELDNLDMPDRY